MKNKKIIGLFIVLTLIFTGLFFIYSKRSQHSAHQKQVAGTGQEHPDIDYWTCSMHPQVRKDAPGECPICGMTLIPIHKQDMRKIMVDEEKREYLGIRSKPVEQRHMIKKIRLPGKVSHDYELYTLQQEYLSILANLNSLKDSMSKEVAERQKTLLDATKLRLKLLGLRGAQMMELEKHKTPDESLISLTSDKVWVLADIYEQDLSLVKVGQQVTAKIKGYTQEFSGKIYAIEDVLNSQTRSAKARIDLKDLDNQLKHEVYTDLTLEIDIGPRLTILLVSVIDTGARRVVYVDTGNGRYELRQIKTGVEAQEFIEVVEGLSEGEHVVTDGNFLLDSQTTLTGGQSILYSGSEKIAEPQKQPAHRH